MLPLLFACVTSPSADSGDTGLIDTGTPDTGETGETGETAEAPPPFPDLHLGVPAFTTADDPGWSARADGAARTGGWIVVDIRQGPDETKDGAWAATLSAARGTGARVVGLVHLGGDLSRDADDVARDIGRWAAWYNLDGVYFDIRGAGDCDKAAGVLTTHVAVADDKDADKDAWVVVAADEAGCASVSALADVLVFPGSAAALAALPTPTWRTTEPAEHFALWVNDVSAAGVTAVMQTATDLDYGTVYATDQADDTPWDTLPAYWADEVGAIVR